METKSLRNFGHEIRIEQKGNDVAIVFVATNRGQADALARGLLNQIRAGKLEVTVSGIPTNIERLN